MLKIESIEKYKGATMQLTFSEGEPAFLNIEIVRRYELEPGMRIPESAWEDITRADIFRRGRERALYLLDYRDYSYAELVKKLMNNYDEDICFDIVDELAERGLINDLRYAESIARRQFEVKLYGAYRVKQKLREKGIPRGIIERVVEPYEDNAAERAAKLVERRYLKYYDPEDRALMQKLKNALARQGYSFSQINDAIGILNEDE